MPLLKKLSVITLINYPLHAIKMWRWLQSQTVVSRCLILSTAAGHDLMQSTGIPSGASSHRMNKKRRVPEKTKQTKHYFSCTPFCSNGNPYRIP
jgi:hypothetical protein